jgi:hypothetical protein
MRNVRYLRLNLASPAPHTIVYITRPDPRSGEYGAWRLASVNRVLEKLQASDEGRSAFDLLWSELLPFSYSDGEPSRWFHVIQHLPNGSPGIDFIFRPSGEVASPNMATCLCVSLKRLLNLNARLIG